MGCVKTNQIETVEWEEQFCGSHSISSISNKHANDTRFGHDEWYKMFLMLDYVYLLWNENTRLVFYPTAGVF